MDDCELIVTVTAIACAISKNCSDDEISIMAAVFTQLGDTLATITTNRESRNQNNNNNNNNHDNNNIC